MNSLDPEKYYSRQGSCFQQGWYRFYPWHLMWLPESYRKWPLSAEPRCGQHTHINIYNKLQYALLTSACHCAFCPLIVGIIFWDTTINFRSRLAHFCKKSKDKKIWKAVAYQQCSRTLLLALGNFKLAHRSSRQHTNIVIKKYQDDPYTHWCTLTEGVVWASNEMKELLGWAMLAILTSFPP